MRRCGPSLPRMGMQVFFTVGEDECRAWGMPKGADAVIGASQIHTDLASGFVRAEVVSYADFQRVGSMKEAKHAGRLSAGRQDLRRPGRRHYAHPGGQIGCVVRSSLIRTYKNGQCREESRNAPKNPHFHTVP